MKPLVLAFASALLTQLAAAKSETIQRITQKQLADFTLLPTGFSVSVTGEAANPVIQVVSEGKVPATVALLTITQPPVKTSFYALRGEVSYSEVAGDGYLEMWSWFGEPAFFSRTLGEGGPMGKLSQQSFWRAFCLPFNATGAGQTLTKL